MRREALLYGINYAAQPRLRLNGCWNDAIGLGSYLTSQPLGFAPEDVHVVMDTRPSEAVKCTRTSIEASIAGMARRSWEGEGLDVVVVSFSGHGSHQTDLDGDESDGNDEGICPLDCMQTGLILDDDLLRIFSKFNPKTRIYAIFDCCHSGSMLDLPYVYPSHRPVSDCHDGEKGPRIIMLSGCRDPQTSADAFDRRSQRYGGALTTALLRVLQATATAAKPVGLLELHTRILEILQTDGYEQYPLLSSTHPITNDIVLFSGSI